MMIYLFSECADLQIISKDDTTDVVFNTNSGTGNGLDVPFVPNPGTPQPSITYTIKSINGVVKFVKISITVRFIQTVKVFVLDTNDNAVAPINPKQVKCANRIMKWSFLRLIFLKIIKKN